MAARGRNGAIESVLRRATRTVVGHFFREGKQGYVVPVDDRIFDVIMIATADTRNAQEGEIVNVEITRPPTPDRFGSTSARR